MYLEKKSILLALPAVLVISLLVAYSPKIALAGTVALALFSAIAWRKNVTLTVFAGLVASIALLPSNYVSTLRVATGYGDLKPSFILLVGFLVVTPFILLVNRKVELPKESKGLLILLGLYFVICMVSDQINGGGAAKFNSTLLVFVFGFGALLFAAITSNLVSPLKLIKVGVGISTIVSLIGVMEFFGYQFYRALYEVDVSVFFYGIDENTNNLRRIVASIGNPLVLSAYLLMCFPFALYLREQAQKKLWWNLSVILHIVAILFTQSRSAFIALAVVAVIFAIQKSSRIMKYIFGFLAATTVFLLLLSSFGLLNRFADRLMFQTESESYSLRSDAYGAALNIVSHNPFFGVGQLSGDQIKANFQMATLDNVFLTIMVNTGMVGVILVLVLLFVLLVRFNRMTKPLKPVSLSLLSVFIITGFSFSTISYDCVWGIFWILTGLIIKLNRDLRPA